MHKVEIKVFYKSHSDHDGQEPRRQMNSHKKRVVRSLLMVGILPLFLMGCDAIEQERERACHLSQPDARLLRNDTMEPFIRDCGLAAYPDVTELVQLHYTPARGDGTLPIRSPKSFVVSQSGGMHERVWYLCMPVPAVTDQSGIVQGAGNASQQAVCRYAGSGKTKDHLVWDAGDAAAFAPEKW